MARASFFSNLRLLNRYGPCYMIAAKRKKKNTKYVCGTAVDVVYVHVVKHK